MTPAIRSESLELRADINARIVAVIITELPGRDGGRCPVSRLQMILIILKGAPERWLNYVRLSMLLRSLLVPLLLSFLMTAGLTSAQGGGLDADRCNHNRKVGDRQCYRGRPGLSRLSQDFPAFAKNFPTLWRQYGEENDDSKQEQTENAAVAD